MANNVDEFPARVRRYDEGSELGPRVLKAGIIDGRSEYSVPIDMYADTADEALREVDWYAAHGYAQIKVYNSLEPALVPLVAERAHALGLRFSGHVPAFMPGRPPRNRRCPQFHAPPPPRPWSGPARSRARRAWSCSGSGSR